LLVELLNLVAGWFPERRIVVCADSAYGGQSVLRQLPANVDLISPVHPQGVLYEPAPPHRKGQRGARRTKGKRRPDLQGWANDVGSPGQELTFGQYGLRTTLQVKSQQALYYKAGKDRLLTIVLTRDKTGKRPDHRFYCTRLDWDVRQILSTYASRWALEVTFEGSKQVLGLEDPANRLPKAVQRTAPMALVLYSLVLLWFDAEDTNPKRQRGWRASSLPFGSRGLQERTHDPSGIGLANLRPGPCTGTINGRRSPGGRSSGVVPTGTNW
jgi:hypothetical protein